MKDLNLHATLWPSFPHFARFARDDRLASIRLNSAMMHVSELDKEIGIANSITDSVPLYFDIKGRQLRITEVDPNTDHLEIVLNHPIAVDTPVPVIFKAGNDSCLCTKVVDRNRLIFEGGPQFMVHKGESIHIRHPSLKVGGPVFCDFELEKIAKVVKAGFTRFYLSYVEHQRDVDELRQHVGNDAEIIVKIENLAGLKYVADEFKKQDNLTLMAARGDLYVEVEWPHHILDAQKLIIEKDPKAYVGSRILLSVVRGPVPDCADLSELAWLYDIGFRNMLLCDELCLKEDLLSTAINVFQAFRQSYAKSLSHAKASVQSGRTGAAYTSELQAWLTKHKVVLTDEQFVEFSKFTENEMEATIKFVEQWMWGECADTWSVMYEYHPAAWIKKDWMRDADNPEIAVFIEKAKRIGLLV